LRLCLSAGKRDRSKRATDQRQTRPNQNESSYTQSRGPEQRPACGEEERCVPERHGELTVLASKKLAFSSSIRLAFAVAGGFSPSATFTPAPISFALTILTAVVNDRSVSLRARVLAAIMPAQRQLDALFPTCGSIARQAAAIFDA
jgi:hypothetical protein